MRGLRTVEQPTVRDTTCSGVPSWNRILGNNPCGRNTPDFISMELGEPYVAIVATNDAVRLRIERRNVEVRDGSGGAHAGYLVRSGLRNPQVAVGARCDPGEVQ